MCRTGLTFERRNVQFQRRMGSDSTIGRVRGWHKAKPGNTKAKLAREAGLHRNTLIGLEQSDWQPSQSTLKRLDAALLRIERREAHAPTGDDCRISALTPHPSI